MWAPLLKVFFVRWREDKTNGVYDINLLFLPSNFFFNHIRQQLKLSFTYNYIFFLLTFLLNQIIEEKIYLFLYFLFSSFSFFFPLVFLPFIFSHHSNKALMYQKNASAPKLIANTFIKNASSN